MSRRSRTAHAGVARFGWWWRGRGSYPTGHLFEWPRVNGLRPPVRAAVSSETSSKDCASNTVLVQLARLSPLLAVERPDVALARDVDLVITQDELAVLNCKAFDQLFSDTAYATAEVATHVQALEQRLPRGVRLSAETREGLTPEGRRLKTLASRLHVLAEDPVIDELSASKIRTAAPR